MKNKFLTKKGFTLLELLISIAIITIIAAISAPVYFSFYSRNDVDVVAMKASQNIRRAQILAQAEEGAGPWGVSFSNDAMILFQGESFQDRDVDFDEPFSIPQAVSVSGLSEVVFERLTGTPRETGTIEFFLNSGVSRSIAINEMGVLSYGTGSADGEDLLADFCGGEGTTEEPYLICNAYQLDKIREDLSLHYKLSNNIDLNVSPFNIDSGWEPIGTLGDGFTGTFNGDGYLIANLYIYRPTEEYNGLFGYISATPGKEAGVYNVGMSSVDITGGGYTGGITGYIGGVWNADGKIVNSYVKGSVTGVGSTGGIAGYTAYKSYLENVYVIANIIGGWGTGGISGSHWGGNNIILNAYSASDIAPGGGVGGIIGQGNSSVVNAFWNTDLFPTSPQGEGKTTGEMKNINTFSSWDISTSNNNKNEGYPHLAWEDERDDYHWLIYE